MSTTGAHARRSWPGDRRPRRGRARRPRRPRDGDQTPPTHAAPRARGATRRPGRADGRRRRSRRSSPGRSGAPTSGSATGLPALRRDPRRLRPPHGERQRLHRDDVPGDHARHLRLPHAVAGLERRRLQLPRRPVRPDLGGPVRRRRPPGRRRAHPRLQRGRVRDVGDRQLRGGPAQRRPMLDAYAALFAWKLSLHGVAADDTKQWVDQPQLPGDQRPPRRRVDRLPGPLPLREDPRHPQRAAALQQTAAPTPPSRRRRPAPGRAAGPPTSPGARWPDLVVRDTATKHAMVVRTVGQLAFEPARRAAASWGGADLVVAPGDLDGDGIGDVVARDQRRGGRRSTSAPADGTVGGRPLALPPVRGPRPADRRRGLRRRRPRRPRRARRRETGELLLYPGQRRRRLRHRAVALAADWRGYDLTVGVDDVDGDGRTDLVARSGERRSTWFPGTGNRPRSARGAAGRWGGFDVITGRGDVTGDGIPDLLARAGDERHTYVYPGDGDGRPDHPARAVRAAIAGVPWLALGRPDGRTPAAGPRRAAAATAALRVYANTGRRNLGTRRRHRHRPARHRPAAQRRRLER